MLRLFNTVVRANGKYKQLLNICNGVIVSSSRTEGTYVGKSYIPEAGTQVSSEKAKAEARADLEKVVDIVGTRKPGSFVEEPEYDDAFIKKHVEFFNRPNIDSWEIRRAIHVLADYDCVPDPQIIIACLKACRRLNDFALAIRFLEVVRCKCGPYTKDFEPYIMQEIKPTLEELGIPTLEEIGYHKPELAVRDENDIH